MSVLRMTQPGPTVWMRSGTARRCKVGEFRRVVLQKIEQCIEVLGREGFRPAGLAGHLGVELCGGTSASSDAVERLCTVLLEVNRCFCNLIEERALDCADLVCPGHDELHVSRVGGKRSLPDAHVVEVAPFLDADEFG